MSSVAADSVASPARASRPTLDRKPSRTAITVFVVLLIVGPFTPDTA
jgi:hypothetical protein